MPSGMLPEGGGGGNKPSRDSGILAKLGAGAKNHLFLRFWLRNPFLRRAWRQKFFLLRP